jgi:tetratricopeptide (TPR) repeat protein
LKADYADTYVDRGVVSGLKGRIDRAIADISKGASLNPKSISDVSRGHFTSPFDDLTTFIKTHATNARAYEMRGILRLFQGHDDLAKLDFQRSLEPEPKLGQEINEVKRQLSRTIPPATGK